MASELGVQTIQHTNGTDALTISSTGVVTPKGLSYWPHVRLEKTSLQTSTANDEVITWDTEHTDNGGNFSTSTNKFTTPISGIYLVTVVALPENASGRDEFEIWYDGSTIIQVGGVNSADYTTMSGSVAISCEANKEIYAVIPTSGDQIYGDANDWTTMTITYLGG